MPHVTASVTAAVMAQVTPMFNAVNQHIGKLDEGQIFIIRSLEEQDKNDARKEDKIDKLTMLVTDAVTKLANREGKDIASDKYKERDLKAAKWVAGAVGSIVGGSGLLTLWKWAASHFWGK